MTMSDVDMIFGIDVDFGAFDPDPEDVEDRPAADPTLMLETSTLSEALRGTLSSLALS
jgi:hypothetical protein